MKRCCSVHPSTERIVWTGGKDISNSLCTCMLKPLRADPNRPEILLKVDGCIACNAMPCLLYLEELVMYPVSRRHLPTEPLLLSSCIRLQELANSKRNEPHACALNTSLNWSVTPQTPLTGAMDRSPAAAEITAHGGKKISLQAMRPPYCTLSIPY